MLKCVRCGRHARATEMFVCWGCAGDHSMYEERIAAERQATRVREQRAWLMTEKGWYGHWQARPR